MSSRLWVLTSQTRKFIVPSTMRYKKTLLRAFPIFIFTFCIILLVDFQFRSHKFNLTRKSSPRISQRSNHERHSAKDPQNPISSMEVEGDTRARKMRLGAAEDRPLTPSPLKLTDIFIAVKTTGRFHNTRLKLLLKTWVSETKAHTYIFTDTEDADILSEGYNVVVTDCQSDHSHQALSCKMSAEYDSFMASDKRWLCHVDDDNYVIPGSLLSLLSSFPPDGDVYLGKASLDKPITAHELLEGNQTREVRFWFATGGAGFCLSRSLAGKMAPWASGSRFEQTAAAIRLPDDCTVGFIVEKRLGKAMVHCPLFHSHLENLLLLAPRHIPAQVTLSYGLFENKMNSIELKGSFSKREDPSRFKTVHCMLYPLTSWCP